MKNFVHQANQFLNEANPDGTISPGEDDEKQRFISKTMSDFDQLLGQLEKQANEIGGRFRGPGIKRELGRLMTQKIYYWVSPHLK